MVLSFLFLVVLPRRIRVTNDYSHIWQDAVGPDNSEDTADNTLGPTMTRKDLISKKEDVQIDALR